MLTTTSDASDFADWIGKSEITDDRISAALVKSFRATFDLFAPDGAERQNAPPGLHWCLCLRVAPTSALGADGHPLRGDFLPPVPLPRRMWAGGELRMLGPLRVGDVVRRRSVVDNVAFKEGRSGPLCFVTVAHEYATASGPVLRERQDIVFRGLAGAAPEGMRSDRAGGEPAIASDLFQRRIAVNSTLLFRYSALTFNTHKIHYDRDYCRTVEGYPGLVVHGPLQATLLLQYAADIEAGTAPRKFSFRSEAPLYEGGEIRLNARRQDEGMMLWTSGPDGTPAMTARATW